MTCEKITLIEKKFTISSDSKIYETLNTYFSNIIKDLNITVTENLKVTSKILKTRSRCLLRNIKTILALKR